MVRAAPVIEQVHEPGEAGPRFAVETSYQGTIRLDEAALEDADSLAAPAGQLARWVASVLVRLGDLRLTYLPPDPAPADDGHCAASAHAGRPAQDNPAALTNSRRSASGRAPRWEMTSPAHTPANRPQPSGS